MVETVLHNPLWERQPTETERAFAAFTFYRDLPAYSRSLQNAYTNWSEERHGQNHGKTKITPGSWRNWSSQWQWVRRAAAWDAELDRIRREKQIQEVEDMVERHARVAVAMQNRAVERLQSVKADQLSIGELVRWMETGVRIERLSRGVPDNHAVTLTGADGGPVKVEQADSQQDEKRRRVMQHPDVRQKLAELREVVDRIEQQIDAD